ncbi:UDP-glycosyltransferase UGT5 isoform X2 [Anabrus simplex]|uniref:UDP-glycosyltransferase UGT5 isoform X2 n=1 Tax=Anabrus simplex TaxID=316456 RepID=UPI0035A33F1F
MTLQASFIRSPAVIALNAVTNPQWTNYMIGNPSYPAYMPNIFLPYSHQMSLFRRMYNIILSFYIQYQWNVNYLTKVDAVVQKYFGSSAPSVTAILQNVSAVMVHTDPSFDYSYLQWPAGVSVAGIHIGKPKKLSKGLKTFLDRAKHGVILFSLGGDLQMSDKIKQKFRTAFLKLDQRILWNWEMDTSLQKPKKIKTGQWISHTDLLAHHNVHLFITQASRVSILEATSQGIPIIGIPFGREQHSNMEKVIARGTGVQLDYKSINERTILEAVQEILRNTSYTENARKQSADFNDHPKTPMERALYWCDYVIRHKGAPHLHSASMGLINVLIFIVAVIVILTILTRRCYKVQTKKKSRVRSKRR